MQGALGTYLNIRCKGTARTTLCSARKRQNRRKFTVTFARAASSSWSNTNPYPFPTSSNPSPYQVFHLLPGASAAEIKQRYYELVKLYHPDAVEPQRSPGQEDATARHARFQAITAAYDKLQKAADPALFLQEERKQQDAARAARRRREVDLPNGFDERWKDRLIWGGLMLTLIAVTAQYLTVRHQRLKDAVDYASTRRSRKALRPQSNSEQKPSDDNQ